MTYSVTGREHGHLHRKIAQRQAGSISLIHDGNGKQAVKTILYENEPHIWFQDLKKSQSQIQPLLVQIPMGRSSSVASDGLQKFKMQGQRSDVIIS